MRGHRSRWNKGALDDRCEGSSQQSLVIGDSWAGSATIYSGFMSSKWPYRTLLICESLKIVAFKFYEALGEPDGET